MDVDLRLRCLPRSAFSGHVGPISCSLACDVFLNVMFRRLKKRQITLGAKRSRCVLKEMIGDLGQRDVGCGPSSPRIAAAWLSIRAERRSPPCTRASQEPVPRHSLTSSIAVDGATGGSAPTTHAFVFHRPDDADAQVRRQGFGSAPLWRLILCTLPAALQPVPV